MLALFLLPANVPALYWELKYWLFGKISQQAYNFSENFYFIESGDESSNIKIRS